MQAHFDLAIRIQAFGIYDGRSNCLRCGAGRSDLHMALAWSVAALAIDSLREGIVEGHLRARRALLRFGNLRISVVTEDALVVHGAHRSRIVRLIVARRHVPIAALFRVPTERQDLERVPAGKVKIRSRMVAGTDHVIHGLLVDVGFFSAGPRLPAPLISLSAAFDHGEVTVRGFVKELLSGREILDGVFRAGASEGPAHARFRILGRDFTVAVRAKRGIDVGVGSGRSFVRRGLQVHPRHRRAARDGCRRNRQASLQKALDSAPPLPALRMCVIKPTY